MLRVDKEAFMKTVLTVLMSLCVVTASQAAVKVEELTYKQGDTSLHGYVYYDDASDSERPGVLVVHEWWGLNDYAKERAKMLAELGYVAMALDMYGEGKTTEHPQTAGEWAGAVTDELGKARFTAAYELLRKHKLTADGKIAAIGYCFGGGVVLRAARAGIDLRGVVSFHGSLPTEAVEPDTIKAKILVCHGAEDPFTSAEQVQKFQQSLTDAGADWQLIIYGGARHSFTSKQADTRGIPALQYNASADRRSWAAMRMFFEEIFAD
jgi:dienelactone hydrolase